MIATREADKVYLTDCVPAVLEDLQYNVDLNNAAFGSGECLVRMLDWTRPEAAVLPKADIILGCEVIYDGMDVEALVKTLSLYLAADGIAYIAVMIEGRGDTRHIFERRLRTLGWNVDLSVLSSMLALSGSMLDAGNTVGDDIMVFSIRR